MDTSTGIINRSGRHDPPPATHCLKRFWKKQPQVISHLLAITLVFINCSVMNDINQLTVVTQISGRQKQQLDLLQNEFRTCQSSHSGGTEVVGIYGNDGGPDFVIYKCRVCNQYWACCLECAGTEGQRKPCFKKKQVFSHKSKQHNSKKNNGTQTNAQRNVSEVAQQMDTTVTTAGPAAVQSVKKSDIENKMDHSEFDQENDNNNEDNWDSIVDSEYTSIEDPLTKKRKPNNSLFSDDMLVTYLDCQNSASLGFLTTRNKRFFQYCNLRGQQATLQEAGIEYLIKTCNTDLTNVSLDIDHFKKIFTPPVSLQILLMDSARLSLHLGKKDRQLLCSTWKRIHDHAVQSDGLRGYPFPSTEEEIRKKYIEGKNSIIRNLPYPEVMTFENEDHIAFVSIEACIRDAIAFSDCRIQRIPEFQIKDYMSMCWLYTENDRNRSCEHPELVNAMLDFKRALQNNEIDNEFNNRTTSTSQMVCYCVGEDIEASHFVGNNNGYSDMDEVTFSGSYRYDDDCSLAESLQSSHAPIIDVSSVQSEEEYDACLDDMGDEDGTAATTMTPDIINEPPQIEITTDRKMYEDHPILKALQQETENILEGHNPQFNLDGSLFKPTQHPSRSKRALEIRYNCETRNSEDVAVSYLTFWSDDCDTNSQAMQGRAQVWVKTMTIATTDAYANLVENTYPVAIGRKGIDKGKVEEYHAQELARLQDPSLQPFFCGKSNKLVKCHFEVLTQLGDNPEKREINGLSRGNSNWHRRSFVAADHGYLINKGCLRACSSCTKKMISRYDSGSAGQFPLPSCQQCLNWDVLQDANENINLCPLPDSYPFHGKHIRGGRQVETPGNINRVINIGGKPYLKPFRITYNTLKAAVSEAHDGVSKFRWSQSSTMEFLKVEGFSQSSIDKIYEHAQRAKALYIAKQIPEADRKEEHWNYLAQETQNPGLFLPWPVPSLYSRPGVELQLHIEAVMHIGPLGIGKSTVNLIQRTQKLDKQEGAFRAENGRYLNSVRRLGLKWLKLMEYKTSKLHGWNASHYLGFIRIMPWFYQNYDQAKAGSTNEVLLPPEEEHATWNTKQCRYWLQLRRLNCKGKVAQLRERVAKELTKDPPPQPVEPPGVRADEIQALITSLFEVFTCILAKEVTPELINKTEHAIRIFLTNIDMLDQKTKAMKDPPFVISRYNFMCLLNIPEQMRTLGPLRNQWEGSNQGEGYLPNIKRKHATGIRLNWAKNLLSGVLRERALAHLLDTATASNWQRKCDISCLKNFVGEFRSYKSIAGVDHTLKETRCSRKKPLSIVLLCGDQPNNKGRIFVVIGNDCQLLELWMRTNIQSGKVKFGVSYYAFELVHKDMTTTDEWSAVLRQTSNPRIGFAVLLPLLEKEAIAEHCLFAMFSWEWQCLGPRHHSLSELVD